jgi:hypothetical protein
MKLILCIWIQGAELKVLSGAKGFVKNIKGIWLEVADVEL